MNHFFDDYVNIKKIIESKKAWRRQMDRLHQLPKDYQYVFEEIQKYMWAQTSGAGYDMLDLAAELLDLFEDAAAKGKPVLEVTGIDVAAFADGLLESVRTQAEDRRETLNRKIRNHFEVHGA